MTEAEAKTKWCPYMKSQMVWNEDTGDVKPLGASDDLVTCIGSACMMWRKDQIPNPEFRHYGQMFHDTTPAYIPSETEGHCGLAHG